MATVTITRTLLRDLPPLAPGAEKVRIFDDRVTGFIAEQRRTGITFYLRYTNPRRRARDFKLGRLGDVTVDQARRKAADLRAEISLGGDPAAGLALARAVPLFADFANDRYLPHVRDRLASAGNIDAYLRLRILPVLGRKPLDQITQADIAALRKTLVDKSLSPSSVNRHLATVRSMFNLAIRWQLLDGKNPAAAPGMLRENGRDAYLDANQTRALFRALDADPCQHSAAALALLALSGARKNEVLHARWADVDLGRCLLTVPKSKNGRPRHIALSPHATEVLRRQAARRQNGHPYVFPSPRKANRPLEDVRTAWVRVTRAAALPSGLRIHDLRHSFASMLANLGTPLNEIGVLLGHQQISTTQRYAHHAPQRLVATAATAAVGWGLPALTQVADEAA